MAADPRACPSQEPPPSSSSPNTASLKGDASLHAKGSGSFSRFSSSPSSATLKPAYPAPGGSTGEEPLLQKGDASLHASEVSPHPQLRFEPTEIPLWRTEGVYDQIWLINKSQKTSAMLHSMNEKNCSSSSGVEDENMSKKTRELIKQLRKRDLSVKDLKALHRSIGERGTFRIAPVHSEPFGPGRPTIHFLQARFIHQEMMNVIKFYNTAFKDCHTLLDNFKLVAYVGAALTSIHPFEDGNGRVTRVLLSAILNRFLHRNQPVQLCSREMTPRKVVYLYALEQANRTWTHEAPESLEQMLAPQDFCAFLIECASGMWNVLRLPEILPKQIVPKSYTLSISKIDLQKRSMQVKACIELDVLSSSTLVQLNTINLSIDDIKAMAVSKTHGNKKLSVKDVLPEPSVGRLYVSFKETVEAGCTLVITFACHSELNGGLFLREFQFQGEDKRICVVNPFPGDARKIWPCWDEPGVKARFTLKIHGQETALSNMPSVTTGSQFEQSMPLSTHQVCLAFGDLQELASTSTSDVPVRLFAEKGFDKPGAQVLVQNITMLLQFYERYFEQPYPGKKLDVVLISGKPSNMLPSTIGFVAIGDDLSTKEEPFVLAEKMAKLWTECLKTTEWWTYWWIDAGLTRLAAEDAVEELFPELRSLVQSRRKDATGSGIPLQIDIISVAAFKSLPKEKISAKAAALLFMFRDAVDHERFQGAMREFFLSSLRNATYVPDDFFNVLPNICNSSMTKISHSWIFTPGLALLDVSFSDQNVTVTQRAFEAGNNCKAERIIPFNCCCGAGSSVVSITQHILHDGALKLPLPPDQSSHWLKINWGESGLFVVRYDQQGSRQLCEVMKSLPDIDKFGLLYDALLLHRLDLASEDHLQALVEACEEDPGEMVAGILIEAKGWLAPVHASSKVT